MTGHNSVMPINRVIGIIMKDNKAFSGSEIDQDRGYTQTSSDLTAQSRRTISG